MAYSHRTLAAALLTGVINVLAGGIIVLWLFRGDHPPRVRRRRWPEAETVEAQVGTRRNDVAADVGALKEERWR